MPSVGRLSFIYRCTHRISIFFVAHKHPFNGILQYRLFIELCLWLTEYEWQQPQYPIITITITTMAILTIINIDIANEIRNANAMLRIHRWELKECTCYMFNFIMHYHTNSKWHCYLIYLLNSKQNPFFSSSCFYLQCKCSIFFCSMFFILSVLWFYFLLLALIACSISIDTRMDFNTWT